MARKIAEIPAEIPAAEIPVPVEAEVRRPGRVRGSETPEEIAARTAKAAQTTFYRGVLDRLCSGPAAEAVAPTGAGNAERFAKRTARVAEIDGILEAGVIVDAAGRSHRITSTKRISLLDERDRLVVKLQNKASKEALPDSLDDQFAAVRHALMNGTPAPRLAQVGVPQDLLDAVLASLAPAPEAAV